MDAKVGIDLNIFSTVALFVTNSRSVLAEACLETFIYSNGPTKAPASRPANHPQAASRQNRFQDPIDGY